MKINVKKETTIITKTTVVLTLEDIILWPNMFFPKTGLEVEFVQANGESIPMFENSGHIEVSWSMREDKVEEEQ